MSLGSRIREYRLKRGFTQSQMAEKLNMTEANFSSYERDKSTPPIEKLNQIASILGVTTDFLLGRTDDPSPIASETPNSIKAWLRAGNPDLTEEEKDELASELEEYFQMRKQRILKSREKRGE